MTAVTGTVSSTTGSSGWTSPNNISTSNGVYATSASISNSAVTGFIHALGNGFSVPSGASIDGVELTIEAKNALSGNGFQLRVANSEARMVYAAGDISDLPPSGISSQVWTSTADQTKTFGSSTNTWGAALTPTIVNDSSFGFRCRFFNINGSAQIFSIDRISITVYYTEGGVQSSQQHFFVGVF